MDANMEWAIQAAKENDHARARELLQQVLQEDPEDEEAWLLMAEVAVTERERQVALRQVLRINPGNQAAREQLAASGALLSPTAPSPGAPEPPPSDEPRDEPEQQRWVPLLMALIVAACSVVALAVGALYVPRLLQDNGLVTTPTTVTPATEMAAPETPTSETSAITPSLQETSTSASPTSDQAERVLSTEPQLLSLPDLVVKSVKIELESGGGCMEPGAELGTTIGLQNAGDGVAGPFIVEVNGVQGDVPTGLAAGSAVSLWVGGYASGDETSVLVDSGLEVEESDEENNTFFQMVPIPTPPATCTPPAPGGARPQGGPATTGAQTPSATEPPPVSVANAAELAPLRITARSIYSDGPSSFMQFEVDDRGNVRIAVDTPDAFEEWYVVDGVVYAGEAAAQSLSPYQAVAQPQELAGFADPFDIFAPHGNADRFTPVFPLHAVLWWGMPERSKKDATEPIHGFTAEVYQIVVRPEGAPQTAYVGEGRVEDMAASVSTSKEAPVATLWVEPESGAILRAQWIIDFESGARAEYRLDVAPTEVGPFLLPGTADLANPAAQHCLDQGFRTEVRTEAGGQAGYCVFPDGTACEAWAFYQGACTQSETAPLAGTAPAGTAEGSPEQTVTAYWEHVGEGEFEEAWELLSPAFQKREFNKRYKSYKQYQRARAICSLAVTEVDVSSSDTDEAKVTVHLEVRKGSACKQREWVYKHRLVHNADRGAWLIAAAAKQ
jgi:hypothetical protein